MTQAREVQSSDDLIKELNADLRARDPMQIMKRQIRVKVLEEIRQRVSERRLADTERADIYLYLEEITKEMERPLPAARPA